MRIVSLGALATLGIVASTADLGSNQARTAAPSIEGVWEGTTVVATGAEWIR